LPKEKSGGSSWFGLGGASKQDPELVKLSTRISEMWNQMKSKYPYHYLTQQPDSGLAISKLEELFKNIQNSSTDSKFPELI
jgi:Zn-dependent M32 family carboxypeptidase